MTAKLLSPRVLAGALVVVVVAAGAGLGLFRVRPGEVALVAGEGGAVKASFDPGWHWRLPFGGELRRLPRDPIPVAADLEFQASGGSALTLEIAGRLGVERGREGDWVRGAGWAPFVDALSALLSRRLEAAVRDLEPAEMFRTATGEQFTELARSTLSESGVRVESLSLRAPAERNPVAAAQLRSEVQKLARGSGRKVLVIGWDGADWLMVEPMLAEGRLPNLARLIARGAAGELRSENPLLSPLLWTTMATGKPVLEHGIADFLVKDPASGNLVPISSASRRVHALWTILPHFGLTADVVAWWATWPAEPIDGTMVTDRVAYQLFDYVDDPEGEGKVFPPEAWKSVQRALVPAEKVTYEEVRRFVDISREDFDRRWASLPPERRQEDRVNHLRKILATTRSYHRIALALLERQADLTMMYYEGTDTVGHLFARFLPPKMTGVSDDDVRRFGSALPEFYEYADELLGELLAAADDDTVVLLVSDHGFFTGEARPASDPADFAEGAPQWHRLYGIIVGAGPDVRPGRIQGATIFDLAPTVLSLLGLPVPRDMPGRALPELVPREPGEAGAQLASYEVLPRAGGGDQTRVASQLDEERLRELVALGYVSDTALEGRRPGAGQRPGTSPPPPAAGSPATDLQGVSTEAYNRGRIYQRQGNLQAASEQYRLAIDRLPSFGLGYASLAQVESLRGDHGKAFDILAEGFSKSLSMPMAAVTGLVDEASKAGRLADAERTLAGLHPGYRGQSAYFAALGYLQEELGRPEPALEQYRRALEIDPLDDLSVERTVALLRQLGREAEARALIGRSFDLAQGQVNSMNRLAVVALRQGWSADAEKLLKRVLASDPGNPGVLANLAATLLRQGKKAEALQAMRQAIERDPKDPRNQFNFGAMLAEQGQFAEALAAFERASELGMRNAQVHIAAAKMSFRLGDRNRAERELVRALEIEPRHPEAQQMLAALRSG